VEITHRRGHRAAAGPYVAACYREASIRFLSTAA
jgi:hypothetical protein